MAKIEVGTYLVCSDLATRDDLGIRPVFKTKEAACADLATPIPFTIAAHTTVKIPLNIRLDIPEGYNAKIYPRSSLLVKYNILAPTSIIDADYKGIVHLVLTNLGDTAVSFNRGDRLCQIEIQKVGPKPTEWEVESNDRSQEGFGGSGLN